jgi:hypothetical protein
MATFTVNTHHAYLNNDIVIKFNGQIIIEDTITGQKYEVKNEMKTHLSAGRHILKSDEHEEEILIEDAIKLGGSRVKNAFVFDRNPWVFLTTKDRLYITNTDTHDEKVEHKITPDEIMSLPPYNGKLTEYFLFKTHDDFAIYNVLTGKIVLQFSNHIFSNGHLVIYKQKDSILVYDFRINKAIVHFEGQYSFGRNKFFFVKEKHFHGLNLFTSYINTISYVGDVKDSDMLLGNYLLRLNDDYSYKKGYTYFSLGNGESNNSMSKTVITSPYYIESWNGEITPHFSRAKEDYSQFDEERRKIRPSYPNIVSLCFGMRITDVNGRWAAGKYYIKLHGEIMSYPSMKFSVPFMAEGIEGETIDLSDCLIGIRKEAEDVISSDAPRVPYTLDKGERKIGESASGNLLVTQDDEGVYLRDLEKDGKCRILQNTFDTSNYANAYFTSDGKNVFLRINNSEAQLFGFEKLSTEPFEVDGFTLARNEGFNGYKPEVLLSNGRKPVWRDPITLEFIPEKEMSCHVFKSPDGKYIANTQMKTIFYNRLTKTEVNLDEVNELKSKYNWNSDAREEEKKNIIKLRKELAEQSDKYDLFGKIIDANCRSFSNIEDGQEKEKKRNKLTENDIERYLAKEQDFASLIIDMLGFVRYRKNEEDAEEKHILIGRSVYFLNYVSFSYDSKYLSFAAKMKEDDFRFSQEGVFEIYDLEKEEIVNRTEKIQNHQLWAVWMTMFSKRGDVAFYDSYANSYLVTKESGYVNTIEATGKSLLCFSPSGKYVACSDQNYIDYTHHPNDNWGHQPSGNVFIHETDNFKECLEQYNDMGDGISGVACRAGNVSSAAFSQDETKLLVVGNDGVVIVRNLKRTEFNHYSNNSDHNHNKKASNDRGNVANEQDYGSHYGEYAGTYAQDVAGYSDDVINDAFDGDPDAYWNID